MVQSRTVNEVSTDTHIGCGISYAGIRMLSTSHKMYTIGINMYIFVHKYEHNKTF